MPNWKKLIVSGSSAELSTLKLTGLPGQSDETTSLMVDPTGSIGTRDLGSNAFTSTTIPTNNNQLTNGAGFTTNTGTVDTSGTPADNDFAKFTDANTIEGRSISETKEDLSLNNVENKSSSTIRGEIVSSNIPNNAADTSGNAATATKLAAAVNIAGVAFDGSEAISLNNSNITNGAGYTTNVGDITGITTANNSGLAGGATSGTPSLSLDIDNLTAGNPDPGEDDMVFVDFSADNVSKVTGIDDFLSASIDGTTLQQDTSGKFIKAKTAAIANGGSGLATADQIHTFVTTQTDAIDADTSGNAATATVLATARNIGGVSFNGSANINLPGVNEAGTQNTSGNAATATALATAREIAGVSFDGTENIALNNNAITNGAGYTTNTGTVDTSGTPADNDFAKFTDANTIEGRSIAETKEDLSLNNVENTAISTFAGSANITTVGTIGTGTWQGTAIASAYLDSDTAHLSGTQTFSGAKTFSSTATFTNAIQLNDNDIIYLGTDQDFEIYHTGTDAYFVGRRHGGLAYFQMENSAGTNQNAIVLGQSGSAAKVGVELRYNNVKRLETTTNGLEIKSLGVGNDASGTAGEIRAKNDITAFYSSDLRLKENIKTIEGTLDKIDNIRAVSYDWKELSKEERKTIHSHTGSDIGVIAQEVEKVFPILVEERSHGYKAVNYEKLSAVLLSAVKELKQEVEELKQKIK